MGFKVKVLLSVSAVVSLSDSELFLFFVIFALQFCFCLWDDCSMSYTLSLWWNEAGKKTVLFPF